MHALASPPTNSESSVEIVELDNGGIERVAWNSSTEKMRVSFRTHRVVDFAAVPESTFRALVAAQAPERFFEDHVRGHFTWRDVISRVLDGDRV